MRMVRRGIMNFVPDLALETRSKLSTSGDEIQRNSGRITTPDREIQRNAGQVMVPEKEKLNPLGNTKRNIEPEEINRAQKIMRGPGRIFISQIITLMEGLDEGDPLILNAGEDKIEIKIIRGE